ncbi:oleate hydratase, partial [Lactobacillus sp. XV13L]|nr:oleate hydratase [Lactobacillus sp. XV13L]
YTLDGASKEIIKLIMTPENRLGKQTIEDFFSPKFFQSNFWMYWATMFAFEKWHSAIEMRRYAMRFIHHIDGLPDFTALKFNRYNQYESMVMPVIKYLQQHNVDLRYDTIVKNVLVDTSHDQKVAKKIMLQQGGVAQEIDLTADD